MNKMQQNAPLEGQSGITRHPRPSTEHCPLVVRNVVTTEWL